jgi:predicted nucleic acid-binding protein
VSDTGTHSARHERLVGDHAESAGSESRRIRSPAGRPDCQRAVFHELAYGVARLPEGERKFRLASEIEAFRRRYEDRITVVDYEVSRLSGKLRADTQRLGRELKPMGSLIAASAVTAGAKLATRNVKDFEHLAIELVNPWTH